MQKYLVDKMIEVCIENINGNEIIYKDYGEMYAIFEIIFAQYALYYSLVS